MLQKTLLIPQDLKLIEELVLDLTLEPRFNAIGAYLVWDDELPSGITPDGLDILASLWTARFLVHRGLTFSDHPVNPEYSRRVWEQALNEIPNWSGFQRLKLSEADQSYFEEMIGKENPY